MKSRIIKLGDYTMDDQDRALQELFATEPLQDNGFSAKVIRRVRRRMRLKRLLLPLAAVFGGVIALDPAMQLLTMLPYWLNSTAAVLSSFAEQFGPLATTLAAVAPPLAVLLVALRLIEE